MVKNTEGSLVWSNALQKGVMEFIDLPKIDKGQHYQLWIYDLNATDNKPIFSTEFVTTHKNNMLIPFAAEQHIRSPFKFELVLQSDGEATTQPLFLAQP